MSTVRNSPRRASTGVAQPKQVPTSPQQRKPTSTAVVSAVRPVLSPAVSDSLEGKLFG
jgi:hypothetical protein